MNNKIDRSHLKQVGLTMFDIQLLTLLMKTAGEYAWPDTPEGQANVLTTAKKNLVQVIQRPGERKRIRLTDEGRLVLTQLEAMAVQPKVEVDNRNQ